MSGKIIAVDLSCLSGRQFPEELQGVLTADFAPPRVEAGEALGQYLLKVYYADDYH